MIQNIVIYALVICIPIASYLSYDYGTAKEKERSESSAEKLTKVSVVEAENVEGKRVKERIVYRDIINTVETAIDSTKCLDTHPGDDIAKRVRDLQSL